MSDGTEQVELSRRQSALFPTNFISVIHLESRDAGKILCSCLQVRRETSAGKQALMFVRCCLAQGDHLLSSMILLHAGFDLPY